LAPIFGKTKLPGTPAFMGAIKSRGCGFKWPDYSENGFAPQKFDRGGSLESSAVISIRLTSRGQRDFIGVSLYKRK
jgi:hypothetical protein